MPQTVPGLVSVIIVNFRGTDDTLECITRLNTVNWPAERLEILVVENGSHDDSEARLRAALDAQENVTLIVSDENLGFTGGSNLGATRASGEFLAFLNNDAAPSPEWIGAAMMQFDESPHVAAVGSKVMDWDGKTIDFVKGGLTWFGMGFKEFENEPDTGEFDEPRDILFGTGSALFVRANAFAEVGGFDENLFMFYDDVDLGWRLNLFGYRVRFAPDSLVYHKYHGSMKSFGDYRETYLLERNALYLLYKNLSDENLAKFLPAAISLVARRSIAKGGLDSEAFDIRRFDNSPEEREANTSVPKDTLAGFYALDQFVSHLPELVATRDEVQERRVRTDRELFRLFGHIFAPLETTERYLTGFHDVVDAFEINESIRRRNILVMTGDSLGAKMAGPAMRAWKIAEALSKENNVRLLTWNTASRFSDDFLVEKVPLGNERSMRGHEQWADIIFFQGHALYHYTTLQKSQKIMIADIYDPMHLEQLEQGREFGTERWTNQVAGATKVLNQQLERADYFLCASERQRLFWLGQLAAVGRINPANYAADDNLRKLIEIVPFGMESAPPRHTRAAIRGVVPGIDHDDKVIIWGGGIYNWFDTLTLVRAVAKLAQTRPNVRLFFLGVVHPNPDVAEMAIVAKTRDLATHLGVAGKNVFFNESWVPLDDRQNYLLEADAGVSTHYDHIETTFSFRTRILDYLWADLPIVSTRGDSFGDLVDKEGLGVAVPERDIDALADALEKVLYDDEFAAAARNAVSRVREDFTWDRVLRPLVDFCRNPVHAADRPLEQPDVDRSSRRAQSSKRMLSREERFQAISVRRHGIRRDLALAGFYMRDGGVGMLRSKVKARMELNKRSS